MKCLSVVFERTVMRERYLRGMDRKLDDNICGRWHEGDDEMTEQSSRFWSRRESSEEEAKSSVRTSRQQQHSRRPLMYL